MVRAAALALLALVWATTADARVVTAAKVRYDTQSGQSDWVKTEVTFMKGAELNAATRSRNYEQFAGYVLIWFDRDQVAIIQLENNIFGCGSEFQASCIPSFGDIAGKDQGGRRWEICTRSFC